MSKEHAPGPWETRAIRLEYQLRRLIYGYRVSGVEALKSEEWKMLYGIAEAILLEGNPIASAPEMKTRIAEIEQELLETKTLAAQLRHQVIQDEKEVAELKRWKAEAVEVMEKWNKVRDYLQGSNLMTVGENYSDRCLQVLKHYSEKDKEIAQLRGRLLPITEIVIEPKSKSHE